MVTIDLKAIDYFTDLSKLRGQGYDGAANISSAYSDLTYKQESGNETHLPDLCTNVLII